MFSLIYGLVQLMLKREEFRILVIGLDRAGKTNAAERLKTLHSDAAGLDPSQIAPTVGLNVTRLEAFGSALVIWDLGGAPGLRAIWDRYLPDAHAVVFVVDATAPARLAEARMTLERARGAPALAGAPVLVLANKQDSNGALDMAAVAEALGLTTGGGGGANSGAPCIVQPASAHTGAGLSDGLQWLVEAIKRSPRRRLVSGNS